jgi:hypothetical protein
MLGRANPWNARWFSTRSNAASRYGVRRSWTTAVNGPGVAGGSSSAGMAGAASRALRSPAWNRTAVAEMSVAWTANPNAASSRGRRETPQPGSHTEAEPRARRWPTRAVSASPSKLPRSSPAYVVRVSDRAA